MKVFGSFVKDSRIFLNCNWKFLFINSNFVFDLFIREAIEQNIQSRINFFCFFFSSLTWVSLRAKIFPRKKTLLKCLQTTQRLTENASEWPHLRRFYANVREWTNIWLNPRPYVVKYANVNAALSFQVMQISCGRIWFFFFHIIVTTFHFLVNSQGQIIWNILARIDQT